MLTSIRHIYSSDENYRKELKQANIEGDVRQGA